MLNNLTKSQKFKLSLVTNSLFALIELLFGIFSNSLALISDALHNWTDSLTLLIAFIADKISSRRADNHNSYGLKRAGILASVLNSLILILMASYIFWQAYHRLWQPEPVNGLIVVLVSVLGIIANGFVVKLFQSEQKDLNVRSAYLNMLFDALASVGALVAGIIIYFTGLMWIDSIVSFVIGGLLIYGAIDIIRDALSILLESVPHDVNIEIIKKIILSMVGVQDVVDLHIWSLTAQYKVLTAVITVEEDSYYNDKMIDDIKLTIAREFGIDHQTIELRKLAHYHED
jgi:cobalt-zinc-cadmium efflux system protein